MSTTAFKTEVNGVKTLADLGMQYATETSKHRVRMAYFECALCKAAYKSIYYRPAKHCKTCQNILQKTKVNEKFSIPIGTVFSRLTVLEETAPKLIEGGGSRKCYKVRCECGKTFITIGTSLKHKRVTECSSCAYQKRPQSTKRLTQEERMFTKAIVDRCKAHNIPYSITAADYITIAKKAKNKTKEENTMENTPQENIIEELFQARYEKLDNIIIKKIHKIKATNKEEKESIKNAIIMEEMYKQGFKDGINLIMQCQKSQ